MAKVALTTSIPVEVVLAAGHTPVDLNNVFITDPDPYQLVGEAETGGFARTLCAWIKGLYTVMAHDDELKVLIAVTQGDCSNTHALAEVVADRGLKVIRFDYPPDRDPDLLQTQIQRLIDFFGTTWEAAERVKRRLDRIRAKLVRLDDLTWQTGQVDGWENHLWQVSSSDFNTDPDRFETELDDFLRQAEQRPRVEAALPLGLAGIPPIIDGLYQAAESFGGRVVYNEIQRQFAMPGPTDNLVEQYLAFTYPYDVSGRVADLQTQIERRGLKGLIHYTQSFCFRQIHDLVLRKKLDLPILTIEADRPGNLDARTRLRLEAFIDVIRD